MCYRDTTWRVKMTVD